MKYSLRRRLLIEHYKYKFGVFSELVSLFNRGKFFFPCLEVPITTKCTLCCKECANLIQLYSSPYHVSIKCLIESIENICEVVDGIDCIRLLGGEPLLHPDIDTLLIKILTQGKINNIVIVTNGTVLPRKSTMELLAKYPKIRISISVYSCVNEKRKQVVKKLNDYGINYIEKTMIWKAKADARFRQKNSISLIQSFSNCPNRFFSLLNGNLFLCPRSSHGTDLGIVPSKNDEFVNCLERDKLREKILQLLDKRYLTACNYCCEDLNEYLPIVPAGVQIKKSDAQKRYLDILTTQSD